MNHILTMCRVITKTLKNRGHHFDWSDRLPSNLVQKFAMFKFFFKKSEVTPFCVGTVRRI